MSHEVESMYYVSNESNGRFVPWHGLGTAVETAPTSAEALELAGLNWTVNQVPIFANGSVVPNYRANIRSSDNTTLGIVTDRYQIVQNKEAFDFTDVLLGEGVRYETAGSLRNGKTIWLLAQMPKTKILDEDIASYLCFTNSHDGTGAIKVVMTPTRVVCNNTLNLALSTAKRAWSTKHIGDITAKMMEAKATLGLAKDYMTALSEEAEKLADQKISDAEIEKLLEEMFPVTPEDSERKINNINQVKNNFYTCYLAPDLVKYLGTKYGVINAFADLVDHVAPMRATENYKNNNWERILLGHPILDLAYSKLTA